SLRRNPSRPAAGDGFRTRSTRPTRLRGLRFPGRFRRLRLLPISAANESKKGSAMVAIESTPEMAAAVYATMARNLAVVRRRLGKPLTLADKILLGHLDDPEHQELEPGKSYLLVRPDRVVFQDVLGQTGLLQFMQTRRDKVAVPATIHCDHLIQARVEGAADLRESLEENKEVYDFLRSAAAKYGLGFWGPGAGIIHQ